MGNTCQPDHIKELPQEVTVLPTSPPQDSPQYLKPAQTLSLRFGEVEKIRSGTLLENNKYTFIVPVRETDELIKVDLPVVVTYSDQLSLKSGIMRGTDMKKSCLTEIIDTLDLANDRQVYHNFAVPVNSNQGPQVDTVPEQTYENFTVKAYTFKNYSDPVLKNGLYEAALYTHMDSYNNLSIPSLRDVFILERGLPHSIVFVHSLNLCTLFDVLQYRQQANLAYTVKEQNYLVENLLERYRVLRINHIVHRDIRPSKVYLGDPGFSDAGSKMHRVANGKYGYELLNLESARKYTMGEIKEQSRRSEEMLQTVRGVPVYCSDELRDHQAHGNQIASYDAIKNDRVQLAKLFAAILTLDPFYSAHENGMDYKKLSRINQTVSKVIERLVKNSEQTDPIESLVSGLGRSITSSILESDHKIAENLLPKLFERAQRERIERTRIEAMFSMHQREQITEKLSKKIEENYGDRKYYENIEILDKIGSYYEGVGVRDNDYYREEVNLLLEILQEERAKGFETSELLQKANRIYHNKLSHSIKTPITQINLSIENSYQQETESDPRCLETITVAFKKASFVPNLPISLQLRLLQARGEMQLRFGDEVVAEEMFEKGLQLSGDPKNFNTHFEQLESKSNFEYLLAVNLLSMVRKHKEQSGGYQSQSSISRSALNAMVKSLAKCELLLQSSKSTKTELPGSNPVKLGKVYECMGDLCQLRQNYEESVRYYERTYRLYEGSEDYYTSDSLKLKILEKTHKTYMNNLENVREQELIRNKINQIKRRQEKDKKDQRSNFAKLKALANQNRNSHKRIFRDPNEIIEEDDSDHEHGRQESYEQVKIEKVESQSEGLKENMQIPDHGFNSSFNRYPSKLRESGSNVDYRASSGITNPKFADDDSDE